ncbi:Eco57I restriction-modification methylase domain-containing protein [Candidatus Sumerlaeota bacterium]|nr:Eco57I restriction-modification methylase domain-containing protein [Candidatus Sumerlaeota bacterium]
MENAHALLRAGKPRSEEPEENTKDQLITPFLEALGYTTEYRRMERHTGEGEVDYVLKRHDGQAICFFEAKHLWETGDLWEKYYPQVQRYVNAYWRRYTSLAPEEEVRWICLGNFKDLYIHRMGDPTHFRHYSLEDYGHAEKVAEIWDLLSRTAMEQDIPNEVWRERHKEGIDERFLQHLKIWRLYLASAYRARNPQLGLTELKLVSQQLLQRLIFIRLLERNYLQPPRWLIRFLGTYEEFDKPAGKSFAESLRETIFRAVHRRWNTDLFRQPIECDRYDLDEVAACAVIEGRGYDAEFAARVFPEIGQGALFEYYHLYSFDFATLTVDVIGEVYEKFLAHDFEFARDGGLRIKDSEAVRKREGIYYTPTHIVEAIVQNTLGRKTQPVLDQAKQLLAQEKFDMAYETILELSKIRVLDPAMGSGSFLRKVLTHMHTVYSCYNRLVHEAQVRIQEGDGLLGGSNGLPRRIDNTGERILLQNVYGVDLDPEAIYTASLNLYHQLIELERDRFRALADQYRASESLPNLTGNLVCGNSLTARPEVAGERRLSFEAAFPFPESPGRFDVVLGNPPYVRADVLGQTRRKQAKAARAGRDEMPSYLDPDDYLRFRGALEESGDYETLCEKWDLMIPFIERGLKLLRPGGLFGMIIKEDYCRAKYAERSRAHLLDRYHVARLDFYPGIQLFPGVGVHNTILYVDHDSPKDAACRRFLHKTKGDAGIELPQAHGAAIFSYEEVPEVGKVPRDTAPLREICYISVGFVGHAHEKGHLGEFSLDEMVSDRKDERHPKPYVEGKDIARYLVRRVRYFEWGTARSPSRLRRPTFPEFLEASPKLLGARIASPVPRLAITKNRLFFNHTVIGFVPWDALSKVRNRSIAKALRAIAPLAFSWQEKVKVIAGLAQTARAFDLRYLLAILNSSMAANYLASTRRSKLDIYPDDYKHFPIPRIPKRDQTALARRSEKLSRLTQLEYELPDLTWRVARRYPWSPVTLRHYQTDDTNAPIRAVPECDVNLCAWISNLSVSRQKCRLALSGLVRQSDRQEVEMTIASIRTREESLAEFLYMLWCRFLRGYRPERPTARKPPPLYETIAQLESLVAYRKGTALLSPGENADRIRQVMEEIRQEAGRNDLSRIQEERRRLDGEIEDMVYNLYSVPTQERERLRSSRASSR